MAYKIRAVAAALIVIILICSTTVLSAVSKTNVNPIKQVEMTDNDASSVSFNWKKVRGADGYKIYRLNNNSNKYELLKDVRDGKANTCKLSKLESGDIFKIKMSAYKMHHNKIYESELTEPIQVYTKPNVPNMVSSANQPKVLNISWSKQKNVKNYIVEYSLDESFSSSKNQEVSSTSITIENLKPKDVYYSRCRAYIEVDGNRVYSDWSDISTSTIRDKFVMSKEIDPNKPMVAFTFDDGPGFTINGSNSTLEILNVLEEYGARATFFMVGSRVNDSTAHLLKKELEIGCELGNHTLVHDHYGNKVTAADIRKSSDRIKKYSGQAPTIFRCPGGIYSQSIREECIKEGVPIAYWSVDTEDWSSKNVNAICNKISNNTYDGAIILMHDIYPTTAKAVKKMVPKLIEQGYQIVTVSELIEYKTGNPPKPGEQYVDYKTINNNT